jgi:hypothetical protein
VNYIQFGLTAKFSLRHIAGNWLLIMLNFLSTNMRAVNSFGCEVGLCYYSDLMTISIWTFAT